MPPQYTKNPFEQFGAERLSGGWPWRLLVFSILLLALMVFLYLAINFGYQPFLRAGIDDLNQEISNLGAAISDQDKNNFLAFYSQLVNLQNLLSRHVAGSRLFDLLEANTNKKVFYLGADLNARDGTLRLEGLAASYDILTQQLAAYHQAAGVSAVVLETARLDETGRGVRFSVRLLLRPNFFSQ